MTPDQLAQALVAIRAAARAAVDLARLRDDARTTGHTYDADALADLRRLAAAPDPC